MRARNIEAIKEVNKEIYEKMKEISIGVINVRGELYELARSNGGVMWDALLELGYEVWKGKMRVEDARKRLMKYRTYMYMRKMLCALKGKKFYAGKEMLDIWSFDSVTKKLKNSGKVSIL